MNSSIADAGYGGKNARPINLLLGLTATGRASNNEFWVADLPCTHTAFYIWHYWKNADMKHISYPVKKSWKETIPIKHLTSWCCIYVPCFAFLSFPFGLPLQLKIRRSPKEKKAVLQNSKHEYKFRISYSSLTLTLQIICSRAANIMSYDVLISINIELKLIQNINSSKLINGDNSAYQDRWWWVELSTSWRKMERIKCVG